MKKLLAIILFSYILMNNALAAEVVDTNPNGILKTSDSHELVFENGNKEIVLQSYGNEDSIEAVLHDNYVIYNGNQGGIGLYIYDIPSGRSYLLNDRGDFESAIFYYDFKQNNEKLYVKAGMEISSMPKICVYDLKMMEDALKKESSNLEKYLDSSNNPSFPNLYKFTTQNKISYCTFGDENYYYDFKWLKDDRMSYVVCSDSICKDDNYNDGKLYESDWNGEGEKLIGEIKDGKINGENFISDSSNVSNVNEINLKNNNAIIDESSKNPLKNAQPSRAQNLVFGGSALVGLLALGGGVWAWKRRKK